MSDEDLAYERDDPKHPDYLERLLDIPPRVEVGGFPLPIRIYP